MAYLLIWLGHIDHQGEGNKQSKVNSMSDFNINVSILPLNLLYKFINYKKKKIYLEIE